MDPPDVRTGKARGMWTLTVLALLLGARQGDPEGISEKLVLQLTSDDPQGRDEAAARLKSLGPRAIPALAKARASSDADLATRATRLIQWIETDGVLSRNLKEQVPGIVDDLAGKSPREWTRKLLEIHKLMYGDGARYRDLALSDIQSMFTAALKGAEDEQQLEAVCSIVRYAPSRETNAILSDLLRDGRSRVRCAALDALGSSKTPESIPAISQLLRDGSGEVRRAAANALKAIGTDAVVPFMIQALEDTDGAVRIAAMESLMHQGRKECFLRISEKLEDPEDLAPIFARMAVIALYEPKDAPVLMSRLKHPDPRIRRCSLLALAYVEEERGSPSVVDRLRDEDPDVRRLAAFACGRLHVASAGKTLAGMLATENDSFAKEALAALGEMGAVAEAPVISPYLKHKDFSVRLLAIQALGDLRARAFEKDLVPCLHDESYAIRSAAVRALGTMGIRDDWRMIASMLQDTSFEGQLSGLVVNAAKALSQLEVRDAVPDLKKALNQGSPSVRDQAARSLCALGSFDGLGPWLASCKKDPALSLLPLNALRKPAAWRILGEKKMTSDVHGELGDVLTGWCREAGLGEVQIASQDIPRKKAWLHSLRGAVSVRDALEPLDAQLGGALVLEDDRMRLLPRKEALEFWEAWAASQPK
jgi:HEAT repeat protein